MNELFNRDDLLEDLTTSLYKTLREVLRKKSGFYTGEKDFSKEAEQDHKKLLVDGDIQSLVKVSLDKDDRLNMTYLFPELGFYHAIDYGKYKDEIRDYADGIRNLYTIASYGLHRLSQEIRDAMSGTEIAINDNTNLTITKVDVYLDVDPEVYNQLILAVGAVSLNISISLSNEEEYKVGGIKYEEAKKRFSKHAEHKK